MCEWSPPAARVKVEADPDFVVNDDDDLDYNPAAFEPAVGWAEADAVADDDDDDDWGYGEKKPSRAGRKRGRPKKEPGSSGRPRGRPKRVKKEGPGTGFNRNYEIFFDLKSGL